ASRGANWWRAKGYRRIIACGSMTVWVTACVVFQEVVHLVRTEEAEVAKLQCSTERPDEQPQECASNAQRSRGHGQQCGGRRTEPGGRGPSVQYDIQDGCQMGQALPRRRCGWVARPLLQTSFIAGPNSARHMHG